MKTKTEIVYDRTVESADNLRDYRVFVEYRPWRDDYDVIVADADDEERFYLSYPADNRRKALAEAWDWYCRFRFGDEGWLKKRAERMVYKSRAFAFYKEYTYDGYTRRTKYICQWTELGMIEVRPFYNGDVSCCGIYNPDKVEFVDPDELVRRIVQYRHDGYTIELNIKH